MDVERFPRIVASIYALVEELERMFPGRHFTPDGHMIVGLWNDTPTRRHGFVVNDGVFHSYDAIPGSSTLTAIWDINPSQVFVGTYIDSTGRHGFLQLPDGSAAVKVDPPGSTATTAFGINPSGVIVGQYLAGGVVHGFVAVPVS